MREEVNKYFNDRHMELYKLVNRGAKYSLPEHGILNAMEHCYDKIMGGKSIPDIELARYVFNVAKEITGGKYQSNEALINALNNKIRLLKWWICGSWILTGCAAIYILWRTI